MPFSMWKRLAHATRLGCNLAMAKAPPTAPLTRHCRQCAYYCSATERSVRANTAASKSHTSIINDLSQVSEFSVEQILRLEKDFQCRAGSKGYLNEQDFAVTLQVLGGRVGAEA